MPKTSSKDRINAAFEEIAEALNNPKMREGCLNGNKENEILNELAEIFDKRKSHNNPIVHVPPRVSQNTKIPYVPARLNHIDSILENRTQDGQQSKKKIKNYLTSVESEFNSIRMNVPLKSMPIRSFMKTKRL